MKSAHKYQMSILSESGAGLGRVLKHMNDPFAVMSAFREGQDRNQNLQDTKKLIHAIMAKGLGGIKLEGHYEEGDYVSDEISFFVPYRATNAIEDLDAFNAFFLSLGHHFHQYSIILSDGWDINLVTMKGEKENLGNAASMRPDALIPAWSKINNKRYGFVNRDTASSFIDHTKLR